MRLSLGLGLPPGCKMGGAFSLFSLDPALWLKLDEGSGTTPQDSSGNGRHGAFVNTPSWDAGPPVSLDFTGAAADGVLIANSELGEPAAITACAWINADVVGGDILNIADTVGFRMNSNVQFFYHYGAGSYRAGSGTFNDTGLHHLALVIDPAGSRQELYVDGVSAGLATFSDAIVYDVGVHTYIGRNPAGDTNYDGRMRQLLVFPSGLTTEQINQVMEATA